MLPLLTISLGTLLVMMIIVIFLLLCLVSFVRHLILGIWRAILLPSRFLIRVSLRRIQRIVFISRRLLMSCKL